MKKDWSEHSKFWMGDNSYVFNPKTIDISDIDTILKLSAYKKAVANFVRIATGKNIPVHYNTGNQSKTNGEAVILSAKLEENQVDPAVGVALHEATHIVKTDFAFINAMHRIVEHAWYFNTPNIPTLAVAPSLDWTSLFNVTEDFKRVIGHHQNIFEKSYLHYMTNFVEDKRIDAWQYQVSPGYRGYYSALYEKVFSSPSISKGIRSKQFRRTETWNSYKFRIVNITNPNTDLDALKGLREINSILDLPNILRLSSTADSFNVAVKIIGVVLKYISIEKENQSKPKPTTPPKKTPKQYREEQEDDGGDDISDNDVDDQSNSTEDDNLTGDDNFDDNPVPDSNESDHDKNSDEQTDDVNNDGENSDEKSESEENETEDGENASDVESTLSNDRNDEVSENNTDESSDKSTDESDESSDDAKNKKDEKPISSSQERTIIRDEKKQDDFLNGEHNKDRDALSTEIDNMIRTCEDAHVSIERVNSGLPDSNGNVTKIDCVVVRKVTHELINTAKFSGLFESNERNSVVKKNVESITAGITRGMQLGRKLQIRNDARVTKYSRLEDGRVDKKLLASLGYGNKNVFYHTEVDKYNPILLHISVDASSSMGGSKWDKTMTTIVAICKAASMVSNLDVVVSFRSVAIDGLKGSLLLSSNCKYNTRPLIAIAYDSRIDKFMKIKQLFKYIVPNGITPEGLAFASILDEMVEGNPKKLNSYFLNFSDGQPWFFTSDFRYEGESAAKHTNSIIRLIRARGISVMSYFIFEKDDYELEKSKRIFKMSYDKDARFINVDNILELATTLNELFLRKD